MASVSPKTVRILLALLNTVRCCGTTKVPLTLGSILTMHIDPIFLGTYEQFLRNPGGIRDPEDSQGEFLALSGTLVRPATWHGLSRSSRRPVRPPDIARVCAIMMIESDGKDLGVMGLR